MSIFKDIFHYLLKKQTIIFLGRAGLHCYYDDNKYFIDSEILVGPPNDIVIYSDSIYLIKRGNKYNVDKPTKAKVLRFLEMELEKRHIRFEVS